MGTHSKKDAENNMYGNMFGDLSALASDDSGEINSFANEVINREVVAGNWRENLVEMGGKVFRWLKNRGDDEKINRDYLSKLTTKDDELLRKYRASDAGRLITDNRVFSNLIPDIQQYIQKEIWRKRSKHINLELTKNIPDEIDANKIWAAIKDNPDVSDQYKTLLENDPKLMESLVNETKSSAVAQYDSFIRQSTKGKGEVNFVIPASANLPKPIELGIKRSELIYDDPDTVKSVTKAYTDAVYRAAYRGKANIAGNDVNIDVSDVKGLGIKIDNIKLNKGRLDSESSAIKALKDEDVAELKALRDNINKRPVPVKGDTKVVNGKKWVFNGKTWLVIGAAGTAWYYKDKLPGIIDSVTNNNSKVDVGNQSTTSPSSSSPGADDLNDSHDSSSDTMKNVSPGGANPTQAPKAYGQDAWDKLKSPPPSQRRKFDSGDDDGWWNAPSSSSPTYDDMGYVGGADESWARTAQRMSPDELDDAGLNNYGAGQVVAAQNFLAYYGLGTGKQPGEQIIPSLLMGNFDGMSFDEYKSTHSEEETRHAMQRFEKGLGMFSEEMTKLANNLESFYTERQRRLEAQSPNQPNQPAQQVQKPNEEPQRTE